jgi:hypothetical protein
MAAECEVNADNGSLQRARKYVNLVRKRAANPNDFVNNKLNRAFATAVVANKSDVAGVDASPGDWVVVLSTHSTFQLLKKPSSNINNWQEYKNPNYEIKLYTKPWNNKAEALKKIHFEERLEFAEEGKRFFALVRWGVADKKLNDFLQYEGSLFTDVRGAHFTSPKNLYYPIPQQQIDNSVVNGKAVLKQNPGY